MNELKKRREEGREGGLIPCLPPFGSRILRGGEEGRRKEIFTGQDSLGVFDFLSLQKTSKVVVW